MEVRIARSLAGVDAADWNALPGTGLPFLRHEFLLALEESGCATPATGWDARHVLLFDREGRLRAALPLYLKSHSWGEFVFDFAWAEAYQRAGLRYYPRLVAAVPSRRQPARVCSRQTTRTAFSCSMPPAHWSMSAMPRHCMSCSRRTTTASSLPAPG